MSDGKISSALTYPESSPHLDVQFVFALRQRIVLGLTGIVRNLHTMLTWLDGRNRDRYSNLLVLRTACPPGNRQFLQFV